MSDVNSGMGAGAFNGGNAGGLKAGIEAAMQVMSQNNNVHNHMPPEVTDEVISNTAQDVLDNARTLYDKNKIVKNHFNDLEMKGDKTTQGLAAFEKAVMGRLGR